MTTKIWKNDIFKFLYKLEGPCARTIFNGIMADTHQSVANNYLPNCKEIKVNKIKDYDYFISTRSKRRKPAALREIAKKIVTLPPHAIVFGAGVPNVNTFPFQEVCVNLKDGSCLKIEGKDLEIALQYMPSTGYPLLVKQLQEFQDKKHGHQDWQSSRSVIITVGCIEGMASVFDTVLEEGDPIVIPVPMYSSTFDMLRTLNLDFIGLEQDKDGIQPHQLREKLRDRMENNKPLPKLIYINPIACNPTGINLSVSRKREIYEIACEYNILIIEDDPYYSVNFLEEDEPSLLSMDVEGRVIRLDSFSKILSSGLRLGYVTGPSPLVRQIELYLQVTTIHTSALSQVLVSKLLLQWGYDGYHNHVEQVKQFYRERRDVMLDACNRYLKGLAEWNVPTGGMFLWVKVSLLEDTWDLAMKDCLEKYLLIVPGHPFTGDLTPPQYNYIRLSFSLASPEQIEAGIKLLSEIILEVHSRKKEQTGGT